MFVHVHDVTHTWYHSCMMVLMHDITHAWCHSPGKSWRYWPGGGSVVRIFLVYNFGVLLPLSHPRNWGLLWVRCWLIIGGWENSIISNESRCEKIFFSRRVMEKWNSLKEEKISATSTAAFKVKYDKLEKNGRSYFDILDITRDGCFIRPYCTCWDGWRYLWI